MAKRSASKLLRMKAQRVESAGAKRRRALVRRYPDVPVQAWASRGKGLFTGEGSKVLRKWLKSVKALYVHTNKCSLC
jgi:hypothetical protein